MSKIKSRRNFIKAVAAGTCGGLIHRLCAPASSFMAYADPLVFSKRVLIVLNFAGGVSYNIAPVYGSHYRDRNPTISYGPSDSIALTADQGLHPSLTSLSQVWQDGQLGLLNLIGVGPQHSRSHEVAADQFWTGQTSNLATAKGWGSKLTSQLQNTYGGISFAGSNAFVTGGTNPVKLVPNLTTLGEPNIFGNTGDMMQLKMARTNAVLASDSASNEAMEHTHESYLKLQANIELLRPIGNATLPNTFPTTGLGRQFADAARLIRAGNTVGVRLIYISTGGFDTHSNERTNLTNRLNEVNAALGAFIECMKVSSRWDDVVIAGMSEFTRGMQNNSGGTDHGLAGAQILMGGMVKGGIHTPAPTAAEIGNLEFIRARHGTFAQVYAEIVDKFMGLNASQVFNGDIVASPYFSVIK